MIWKATGSARDDVEERNRVSSFRGFLFKLRRSKNLLAPQWGKRWITIEGHFLKWYRSETDSNPSGLLDLKYIRSITKSEGGPAWTFVITCEERTMVLRCASKAEMLNWIRALHIQADIARGGTGMMVVSDFNQIPLDFSAVRYGGPKNRKNSTTLSLEAELEITLQKLQELEKAEKSEDFVEEDITHQVVPKLSSNQGSRNNSLKGDAGYGLPSGVRSAPSTVRESYDPPSVREPIRLSRDNSVNLRASRENSGTNLASYNNANPTSGYNYSNSNSGGLSAAPSGSRSGIASNSRSGSRQRNMSPDNHRGVCYSDDLEDSAGSMSDVPVRAPRYSISQPGTPSIVPTRVLERRDSDNSIEDISLDTKKNSRVRAIHQQRSSVNSKRAGGLRNGEEDEFFNNRNHHPASAMSPDGDDVVTDEFDHSDASPVGPKIRAANGARLEPRMDMALASESFDDSPVQVQTVRVISAGRHQAPPINYSSEPSRGPRQATATTQKSLRSAWDTA